MTMASAHTSVSYAGKLCLAPMVRSGELPTRIMALKYGADLVWSPEIVDRKIRVCKRVENKTLGTVDFIETGKDGLKNSLIFRTNRALETGRLIFQLGSADPEIAVEAASHVIGDVDGIDLNCGCPKPFSTHAGMGAALLLKPELLTLILRALVERVGRPHGKPISAKIRLLDQKDPLPTLALVEQICQTGISNLTVHCRTRDMRNRDLPIRGFVNQIYDVCAKHGVSLVINGAFTCKRDVQNFQKSIDNTMVGGMIAEAAESNPTVFSSDPLPYAKVVPEFIRTCMACDNHPSNSKYIVLSQLPGKLKFYQQICKVKTHEDILKVADAIGADGAEGDRIFVRTMQKDRLYDADELGRETVEETKKRPHDATAANSKKAKTVCV